MILHTIHIDLVATEDGDISVEVQTEGDPTFITGLGMLEMAKLWMIDDVSDDDDETR